MEKDIQKQNGDHLLKKRLENVAAALYLVTNHLSDQEPLKTKSREAVHIVLEECIIVSDIADQNIITRLDHIRSILKVASMSGLVSSQNISLLENEILAIQGFINEHHNAASNLSIHINDILMLGDSYMEMPKATQTQTQVDTPKSINTPSVHISTMSRIQKPVGSSNPSQSQAQISKPKKEGVTDRQAVILREIRTKGQLTIRDLVGKIEGCSEKTIQRELLSLVESGVLKKEGERRWSKYSVR